MQIVVELASEALASTHSSADASIRSGEAASGGLHGPRATPRIPLYSCFAASQNLFLPYGYPFDTPVPSQL